MTLKVLTGLTEPRCTSGFGGRDGSWQVCIRFAVWRFDDGPLQESRLRVDSAHVPKTYVHSFHELVPSESVVRVSVRKQVSDEVNSEWELVEVLDSKPNDDQELLDMAKALQVASPPDHPSDMTKVVPTVLVRGGEGTSKRFTDLVAIGSENFTLTGRGARGARLDSPLGAIDSMFGLADPGCIVFRNLNDGHTVEIKARAGNSPRPWDFMASLLDAFSDELGAPVAAELGLEYWRSPAEMLVPDVHRKEPFMVPGVGEYTPAYTVSFQGEQPEFRPSGYQGPLFAVPLFGGAEFDFDTDWNSEPPAAEAELAATAISNLIAAGPEVLAEAAPYLLQYYMFVRDNFSDDECREIGIPLGVTRDNIWDYVGLGNTANLRTSPGFDDPLMHPNSAYLVFQASCAWEEEHGLSFALLNGNRISYVGQAGGTINQAAATGDPANLNKVFHYY